MHSILLVLLLYSILVFGYPVSRFLIEIQEPSIGVPLTKSVMVKEDIQTFYENLLDEVISSHSEEFLLSMTHSMTLEKMDALYRPHATLLLGSSDPIHDVCLFRMPQWIGKYLHDSHARTYAMVAPLVDDYMDRHWPSPRQQQEMTPDDIKGFLVLLNKALIAQIDQTMLDPHTVLSDLSLKLQTCQYRYNMSHGSFLQRVTVRLFGVQLSKREGVQADMQNHFLVKYLNELRSDFLFQLNDDIPELVQLVQTDLDDDFVSD